MSEKRRFKQSTTLITFQDAEKKPRVDPEVIGLWPTDIDVEDSTEQEVGAHVKISSGFEAGGQVKSWKSAKCEKYLCLGGLRYREMAV
ncbi:hypothetical protein ACQKWADRAFT_276560 [Trichoderma austrokoningii]